MDGVQLALAAKYIGAGLACIGMGATAIGVANVFGQFLTGALRNPSAAGGERNTLFLGFALAEAFGIFSLLIALLLLFVL
jgi:F-type H+-transporting ATPase subunit c